MTEERPGSRPEALDGGRAAEPPDARVLAVLAVLGGRSRATVAHEWSVEPALLHRWVRDFVDAGTAQITNRPAADEAQQRDRFLAAFAHEVRTPLTVAQGWVEMLKDDQLAVSATAHAVDRLADALDRLASRTLDVQLLAAASMGRLTPRLAPVRVGGLVGHLPGAPDVGGAGPEVVVRVDPELFALVLRDLWQAGGTPPEPRALRLVVTTVGPWTELRVERDADPIAPQLLQALFDPFALNDDATGITIGLYLARALAVAHGGTIGVEQDDEGAALWVRVPAVPTGNFPRP